MFNYREVRFETYFDIKTRKVDVLIKNMCPKQWDTFVATINHSHLWLKHGKDLLLGDISPDANFEKIIDDLIDDLEKFEYELEVLRQLK